MSAFRQFDWDRWQEVVDFARQRGYDFKGDEVTRGAHTDPRVTATFVQRPVAPAPPHLAAEGKLSDLDQETVDRIVGTSINMTFDIEVQEDES